MNKRNRTSVFPRQATHTHIGTHVERLLAERPELGLRLFTNISLCSMQKTDNKSSGQSMLGT
jgi:hypothetical protein